MFLEQRALQTGPVERVDVQRGVQVQLDMLENVRAKLLEQIHDLSVNTIKIEVDRLRDAQERETRAVGENEMVTRES